MKIDVARQIALKVIYEIEEKKSYSNLVLDEYINKNREKLSIKDINLISEIVYGVTTWKLTIDTIIQKYSKTKLNKIASWVLQILRIGVYQIVFLDKIPKSAAVNECVNLCKKYGYKSTSFVNAILRKVEKSDYEELKMIEDTKERISKVYAMPEWLVEELLEDYSIKTVEEICSCSNQKPMTSIRINTLKTTKQEVIEQLQQNKIEYEQGQLEDFLLLKKVKEIGNLEMFQKGLFTVQDEGAGKIAIVLDPQPGQVVLDACSAPGGKTTHMAQLMKNQGEILAWDLHQHRIKLVEETAKRLGITIIKTQTKNAIEKQEDLVDKFDKILLDVPCLGFGVLKRKPDIKWQRKKEEIEQIQNIQLDLLKTCSKYLKIGGELVYSTCSILKKENEDIIDKFMSAINVEESRNKTRFSNIYQKLILPNSNSDGFFICKIKHQMR